jgi:hypothetical protein
MILSLVLYECETWSPSLAKETLIAGDISGSIGGEYEYDRLLGCSTV